MATINIFRVGMRGDHSCLIGRRGCYNLFIWEVGIVRSKESSGREERMERGTGLLID